jgi:hypothetical protein
VSGVQARRFHIGGTTWPSRTAMITMITPVVVHSTNAGSEASRPKFPPVSSSGPLSVAFNTPCETPLPDTLPEKIESCVKFQAMWNPMLSHRRRVSM